MRDSGVGTRNSEIHFDSVRAWVDYALAIDSDNYASSAYMFNKANQKDDFFGFRDGAQVRDEIVKRECSEEIRKEIHKKSVTLPPISSTSEELAQDDIFYDESGLYCDMTAYYSGEEQCMINYDQQSQVKPVIWLACNIGALAGVVDEQFKNRGVSLIRAIHALERAGVSIGLIGYSAAAGDFGYTVQTIVVKQPDNALDETTIINVFAQCACFRSIGFATRCTVTESMVAGGTRTVTKDNFKLSYANPDDLVILPYTRNMDIYDTAEQATDWTIQQIKQQSHNIKGL